MAGPNTDPLYTLTPNISQATLPTANAVTTSDGVSSATGNSNMYKIFTSGANGSYLDRVRVYPNGAAAAVSTVATTVRIFKSTVNSAPSATTAANTFLLAEVSIPTITSGVAHSTNAVNYYDVPINMMLPTGVYILACQHVAQGTNCFLNVMAIGGDY